ncbi:MAG: YHS domain-containing protein [Planctomycetota bacterium]|nr:YHS domain-containing protein [Planctomycetota bacterium]
MQHHLSIWLLVACLFAVVVAHAAAEEQEAEGGKDAAPPKAYPYPLDTCVVSGKKLTSMGTAFAYEYKGRPLMFCCKACVHKLEEKPDEYLKKLDAAIVEKQKAEYPLKTCVVSGEALEEAAVDHVHENRLVRFCCDGCAKEFNKDPGTFLKKLDAASSKFKGEEKKE